LIMFESTEKENIRPKSRAAEIVNTIEWLVTAFILAFVFRAFVMEAFRIPTGSMADTLKGAHFQFRCPQCSDQYDYGFIPKSYGMNEDSMPHPSMQIKSTSRCPNCGYYNISIGTSKIGNGDRILVLKCLYQFFEPKRWDVVVFKNPNEPKINYIKRLIAKPGETVEIIDGDIYIDGEIARKPPKAQQELWMPVYNNDMQPVRPNQGVFNGHRWQQPFRATEGSNWQVDPENSTQFVLDSDADKINTLFYDTNLGNDFKSTYAYNNISDYRNMEFCSDLKVSLHAQWQNKNASVGAGLSKYDTKYKAMVSADGQMTISADIDGETTTLAEKKINPPTAGKTVAIEFINVDHKLIFNFDDEKLSFDLGADANSAGEIKPQKQAKLEIYGSGKVMLSHLCIERDIHYLSVSGDNRTTNPHGQAICGPFELDKDEFFVCGDNSANSYDSRLWETEGIGNNGRFFRKGVVPREYLVGKALFVYWPNGFRPFPNSKFGLIPNIGQLRLIYGGSDNEL